MLDDETGVAIARGRGRPAGELSAAITAAIERLGPLTLRDIGEQVQSTPRALSSTLRNMLRGGHLTQAGMVRRPHCKRWCAIFDLPNSTETPEAPAPTGAQVLAAALGGWMR
jgi:hypothetical protein